jgi:signal transduction histidine kinase
MCRRRRRWYRASVSATTPRWGGRPSRRGRSGDITAFDVGLTAFVTVVSVAQTFARVEGKLSFPSAFSVALAVVAALPIAWRRRNPMLVLALVEGSLLVRALAVRPDLRAGALPLIIAVYTVAATQPRSVSFRAAAVVAGLNAAVLGAEYIAGNWAGLGDIVFYAVLVSAAWAVGDNIGTRRAYLAGLVERAERLERERETATQQAALEERTRIARELHDVVAHHVSAIAVQAGAAEEIAERDPVRAREVLATIQATSRQALTEMRALVGVLQDEPGPAFAPAPHLSDVEQLAAQSRAAGLDVRLRVDGTPRALPEALDLSAYRIVQEALTNTLKHAGAARVDVTVRYGQDSVELVIEDDGHAGASPEPLPGAGRGLVGMRERVALFHGRLELGRASAGGFRVHAVLPLGTQPS